MQQSYNSFCTHETSSKSINVKRKVLLTTSANVFAGSTQRAPCRRKTTTAAVSKYFPRAESFRLENSNTMKREAGRNIDLLHEICCGKQQKKQTADTQHCSKWL